MTIVRHEFLCKNTKYNVPHIEDSSINLRSHNVLLIKRMFPDYGREAVHSTPNGFKESAGLIGLSEPSEISFSDEIFEREESAYETNLLDILIPSGVVSNKMH